MEVTAVTWNALSKLLDEALDLEPAERTAWLDRLTATQPMLALSMRKLLAAHASSETADVLAQLPALGRADSGPRVSSLAPGDRIGPYRLKREIGAGGMADVWLAERADGAFTREVALKLPLINRLRRDLAQRFARERDILARLEHPHIARLYDAGVTNDGLPYLAMEYVDGQPITEYCDAKRLDINARLKLFQQVLEAVQFAHANLIIHRDLKPSNILVTEDGQARLLDFGIAKLLADDDTAEETQLTQLSGRALTPDYASPEQVKGEPLTIATDVYSLGVVLFELLAGTRPYKLKVRSAAQLEQAIIETEAERPSSAIKLEAATSRSTEPSLLRRMLAGDLDTITLGALTKSPTQRYSTIADFAQDLRNYTLGMPVRARSTSWAYRASKFVVRNRVAVGAAGLVSVALVVATAVSSWQAKVAREQATRAEQVKQFVLSIFQRADTGQGGTRKTTAADLLSAARDKLEASQINDPATKVELLTSMGFSLLGLGEYKQGTSVLEEAVQLAQATLGSSHRSTAAAHLALGEALIEGGQFQRAGSHLDAAEVGLRRAGDVPDLVNTLRWKAILRSYQDQREELLSLAKEAAQLAETLPPERKRIVYLAYHTLTDSLLWAGQEGRLPAAVRTYELAQELKGSQARLDLLTARRLYGIALVQEGDSAEGLAELTALLPQQIELLGPLHNDVKRTLDNLGFASMTVGDPLSAIGWFRRFLQIESTQNSDRPTANFGAGLTNLGGALANAARYDEAEVELRRAVKTLTDSPGGNSLLRRSQANLGFVLTRLGRPDEADVLFSQLLEKPFADRREEAITKLRLGILRTTQNRSAEAVDLLKNSVTFFSRAFRRDHALALSALGEAQLASGDASAALRTLTEAKALLESLQPRMSPDRAELVVRLVRTYLTLGNHREALVATADAVEFWNSFERQSRDNWVAHLWRARSLAAAGDIAQANDVLREADSIDKFKLLPGDRALREDLSREIELLALSLKR